MSPFRPDRRRRGPDRFLGQKMLLFVLGAVAGVAGMATDTPWLVYLAVALLAAGLILRVASRRREPPHGDADAAGT